MIENRWGLEKQLNIHKRRLNFLKEKEAAYGLSTPPEILIEIEDLTKKIAFVEKQLSNQFFLLNSISSRKPVNGTAITQAKLPIRSKSHEPNNKFSEKVKGIIGHYFSLWKSQILGGILTILMVVGLIFGVWIISLVDKSITSTGELPDLDYGSGRKIGYAKIDPERDFLIQNKGLPLNAKVAFFITGEPPSNIKTYYDGVMKNKGWELITVVGLGNPSFQFAASSYKKGDRVNGILILGPLNEENIKNIENGAPSLKNGIKPGDSILYLFDTELSGVQIASK